MKEKTVDFYAYAKTARAAINSGWMRDGNG
jgi:hypothetical protein